MKRARPDAADEEEAEASPPPTAPRISPFDIGEMCGEILGHLPPDLPESDPATYFRALLVCRDWNDRLRRRYKEAQGVISWTNSHHALRKIAAAGVKDARFTDAEWLQGPTQQLAGTKGLLVSGSMRRISVWEGYIQGGLWTRMKQMLKMGIRPTYFESMAYDSFLFGFHDQPMLYTDYLNFVMPTATYEISSLTQCNAFRLLAGAGYTRCLDVLVAKFPDLLPDRICGRWLTDYPHLIPWLEKYLDGIAHTVNRSWLTAWMHEERQETISFRLNAEDAENSSSSSSGDEEWSSESYSSDPPSSSSDSNQ